MTTRKYTSRSQQTTLTGSVTSGASILPVVSATTLFGGATVSAGQTFTVVIDPDTALEEVVDVTSVSSNNLTVTRQIDGSTAQDHSAGAVIRHMIIGRDLRESNLHIEASTSYNDGTGTHTLHGLGSSDGSVVGTTATQTLTNKTLTAPTITNPTITNLGDLAAGSVTFEGATVDSYQTTLTVVDPTADRTISMPDATGQIVLRDTTDTLTNKTLTSPTISGSPVITGLSSSGMSTSSATPKSYVDAILGSATAASTSAASAATSASSAATSASSAATSASSALTSQTAAATSASSAATSATAAASSATAAATSATSSASSATASASSATAAASSATTAANSVAAIASYASAASTSANSAATSASSAATSASSAATSASSAATSATSAATSATSAATTYTAYDQRYLGSKSSAPTLNNQGGALITGATYWNTTTTTMYVWTGSTWVAISNASAVTGVSGTSGRVTSTGGTTPVIDLATTAVTSGSYTYASLTVDSYGRLTAASNGTTPVTSVTSANTANIAIAGTATAPTVNLSTTAVTSGSYTTANITVDAYGRITAASSGTAGSQVKIDGGSGTVYTYIDFVGMGTDTATTGTVKVYPVVPTGSDTGRRVYVGSTTPSAPGTGDIWIDATGTTDPDLRIMTIMGAY